MKAHLPIDKRIRTGDKREDTNALIVHWAEGQPKQTAFGIRKWQIESEQSGSYNYIVDNDGSLETIPSQECAHHSGTLKKYRKVAKEIGIPPYKHSIGILFCQQDVEGNPGEIIYNHLVQLCTTLCLQFYLSYHQIYRHHDITGKVCPRWFVHHPEEWLLFIDKVKEEVIRQDLYERFHTRTWYNGY